MARQTFTTLTDTKWPANTTVGIANPGANDLFREVADALDALQEGQPFADSSAGTDAYAITCSPAFTALVDGMQVAFRADVANTGPATLAVDGLAAKALMKYHDQVLATGDLEASQLVVARYNATDDWWEIVSPLANGNAVAELATHESTYDHSLLHAETHDTEDHTAFAERSAAHSGLTYGYSGGRVRDDATVTTVADGTVLLTDDATNYVELAGDGTISANTSGYTSGRIPLATVVTAAGAITTVTDQRTWVSVGGDASLLNKYDATAAPTANDDSGDGYAVGSRWVDVTNDNTYTCVDATAGAAVWKQEDGGGAAATTFVALTDTPANYTGHAGKYAKVNAGETGLEFDTPAGGGDMLQATYDTDGDGYVDGAATLNDGAGNTASAAAVAGHLGSTANPHGVTYAQVGADAAGTAAAAVSSHESTYTHGDIALNTAARHSHANKALLDTYTQTDADLAAAVGASHSHANQAALDAYDPADFDAAGDAAAAVATHEGTYTHTDIALNTAARHDADRIDNGVTYLEVQTFLETNCQYLELGHGLALATSARGIAVAGEVGGTAPYNAPAIWWSDKQWYMRSDPDGGAVSLTNIAAHEEQIDFRPGTFDLFHADPAPYGVDTGAFGSIGYHAFDDTTQEYVEGVFTVPSDLDTAGTVTFRATGYAATAAAARYVQLSFEHSAASDSDSWDVAYTAEDSGDLETDPTQDDLDAFTWTETVSNLGWAAGDQVRFRLSRTAPTGTNLTGDWRLTHFRVSIPRG